MADAKCPRCGTTVRHVAINYLGRDGNGHRYECPGCGYSEHVGPRRGSKPSDTRGLAPAIGETVPRFGASWFDGGEKD